MQIACSLEEYKTFIGLVSHTPERKLHCLYATCGCAVVFCTWIAEPTWIERQVAAKIIMEMDVYEGRLH